MRPTIKDLADELGVHKATVSRALCGKPGVSQAVRQKILRTALQRGFYPNGQARSLATSRTETVALVFCDETSDFLTNPFYSKVLAGIASEIKNRAFSLAFCSLSVEQAQGRNPLPKIMRERRADGYLFVGDQHDSIIKYAHNLGYPLVLVDHRYGGRKFDTIAIDNVEGGRKAVEHLISLGHRRIGFVGGSLRSPSFKERLDGYRAALEAHGYPADADLVQLGASQGGHETMLKLLALPQPPTAVFASNDVNAVRALKAIQEKGLKVPEDVSVIGFDDSARASESWPPLTTMRVDAEHMGRLAVQKLLARVEQEERPVDLVLVGAELVVRQSTAAPARISDKKRPNTGKA